MTRFTIFNDKKVAYSVFGNGFPIVFVHGFCEDRSMWNSFIIPFTTKYKVITIDVGGFGETELPQIATIEAMATQVNAVLIDEGIEKCIFVGHSMGGYVGLAFARQFGEKLQGLSMFHSHPFGDTSESKIHRDRGISFINKYGSEKYIASMLPLLFSIPQRIKFQPEIQKLILSAQKTDANTIINALTAMKNRPNSALFLEQMNCPVQFIIGKSDNVIRWEDSIKQTSLPNIADIQIFENIGHMGMFQAIEETQQVLLDFCEFIF